MRQHISTIPAGSPGQETVFVVLGSVRGRFRDAAELVRRASRQAGPIDVVFGTGNVEPNRDSTDAATVPGSRRTGRRVGEFPGVRDGSISFGVPVLFVGGAAEPWMVLDGSARLSLAPNVWFLGRAGFREVLGLRVVFLSGIAAADRETTITGRWSNVERAFFSEAELSVVSGQLVTCAPVTLFLTHAAPLSVYQPNGVKDLATAVAAGQPAMHAFGELDRASESLVGDTRVVGVGSAGSAGGCLVFVKRRSGVVELVESVEL